MDFQVYMNENGDLIASKSDEAFANGWCHCYDLKEFEVEKKKSFKERIISLFKLGGKRKRCKK